MDARQDEHPFLNFSHSIGAARVLLSHAQDQGSAIEGLVLYASVIDGLLRILIAHATGKRERDAAHALASERGADIKYLDERYFSHDETLRMDERKVYRTARRHGVLSKPEFRELDELYDFRNKVIHRFVISGITYDEILPKLDQYEVIYNRLATQLAAVEGPEAPVTDERVAAIRSRVARKLGGYDEREGP
jgi:hypothetical protein